MAIEDLRLAIRRRPVALAAIFLTVTALAAVRLGDRPPGVPVASTKVVVLPDPRVPVSTATPVLPAYQTFGTKVGSIDTAPVLRRAARLALGDRAFASSELRGEHLRAAIAAGIAATHARVAASGESREDAVETLASEIHRSLSIHPISRKQIVEIRVAAETPTEAAFLSWAVADAAHQIHGERMRREADAMRERLRAELEEAHGRLREVVARECAAAAPTLARLRGHGRLLAVLATRLEEDEVRLRVAAARIRLGLPLDGLDPLTPPAAWFRERYAIAIALETARVEERVLAASLSPGHPDLARRAKAARTLAMRLTRADAARNLFGERRRAAMLRKDRNELALEHALHIERRERLAEETAEWRRQVAEAELAGSESTAIRREIEDLSALERRVRWFADALGSPVVLLSPAMGAHRPEPPLSRALLLALLASSALVATLAGAVAVERWRDVLRGRRDVEDRLGLPLHGVVPVPRASLADPNTADDEGSPGVAALAASLCDSVGAPGRRVVAVAGAGRGEGRTTVAIEVAAALARRGRSVLLVEGNLREPALAARLGLPAGVGLASCVVGAAPEGHDGDEPFETALPGLAALTGSPLGEDRLAILDPARLRHLLDRLAQGFDHVIVDTPALVRAGDALSIASAVDGVLLVAASHRTPRAEVAEARRQLEAAGGRLLGAVLAGFPSRPAAAFSRRAEGQSPITPTARIRRSLAT